MHEKRTIIACTSLILGLVIAGCGPAAEKAPTIPDTAEGTVTFVTEQLAAQHPEVLWDALPASYQADITQITHDFATKMDPELYNQVFALSQKAVGILQAKKEFILSSSSSQMAPEETRKDVVQGWDTALTMLGTVLTSEVSDLESLKTIDLRNYLANTGKVLMEQAEVASAEDPEDPYTNEFMAKVQGLSVEVLESQADTAKLRISVPDEEPEEVEMVKIEERWVPAEMAATWNDEVAEIKTKINEIDAEEIAKTKVQAMMGLAMADAFLEQLNTIESAEEFDALIGSIMGGMKGGPTGSDG